MTSTLTVTEFVEARIAEDEAVARAATPGHWAAGHREVMYGQCSPGQQVVGPNGVISPKRVDVVHIARHDPPRVLAQCAAMRKIVERHSSIHNGWHDDAGEPTASCRHDWKEWPCPDLRALASIWSSHPDFRQEWRA
jgi:hypothetical protein